MEIEYRYSKNTLMRQRKEELVNYIQCLESNNNVLWEIIESQTKMLEALYDLYKDDLEDYARKDVSNCESKGAVYWF